MRQVLQPVVFGVALLLGVIPNVLMGQSQTNVTRVLINGRQVEIPEAFMGQPPSNGVVRGSQAEGSPEYRAFGIAQQAGDVSEMMKQAQALAKAFPNEASPYICEGIAYSVAGLKKDGLASFQHALQLDPKSDYAAYDIGRWYFEAGDPTNALEHFERAVKIRPENSYTWEMIGLVQSRLGNFRDAATALTQAVKLDATSSNSWSYLGGALARTGDAAAAKAAYLMYYKLNPKLAGEFWDARVKFHRDAAERLLREFILSRRKDLDGALRSFREYQDIHDRYTGGSSVDRDSEKMLRHEQKETEDRRQKAASIAILKRCSGGQKLAKRGTTWH